MRIKIENKIIFGSVSTHNIPDFYKELTDKIFEFFKEHGVVISDVPYKFHKWQENLDTGIYVYPGRITSVPTYSDWIVEGFIRSTTEYDPKDFIYTHKLMIQNSYRKVKIEMTVLIGAGNYAIYFDLDLPGEFEKPFVERLLATS
jgi:hypothetical protein